MTQPVPQQSYGRALLDRVLAGTPSGEDPLTHIAELPGRASQFVDWPSWLKPEVSRTLISRGITRPW
ncbi:MAG: hypothetical protein ABIY38_02940, partial [Rhodococcus sp. (in: high G+C Gram-positive bacteria)]